MDLVVVGVVLAPAALMLCVCAIAVRLGVGSGVLFRVPRAGLNGRPIDVVKLCTTSDERDGAGQLLPEAERLTWVGALLRRTGLDELPQLWNVLRGDMSVVGPRPLTPEFVDRYSVVQQRRLAVKPGLTGWAQLKGRNAATWPESFEFDVWYVDHATIWLDLRIMVLTAMSVVLRFGRGDANEHGDRPEFTGEVRG